LQGYRRERGAYPILSNNPIGDIKKQLVSGGYLAPDQTGQDKDARYVSVDGKSYGLLFHIKRDKNNPLGTPCLIEVDARRPHGGDSLQTVLLKQDKEMQDVP